MTMSGFWANPRQGHLDHVKCIIGYAVKFKHVMTIHFRTKCPDYSHLPATRYDWNMTPYRNIKEEIPNDCSPPLGNPVITTCRCQPVSYFPFLLVTRIGEEPG